MVVDLDLEPLADDEDPWVRLIEVLAEKIVSPRLSLVKYLDRNGFGKLSVFPHFGPELGDTHLDPPLKFCPAVVLETVSSPPPVDRGIGDERWNFSVGLLMKFEIRDGDQRKAIRVCKELYRTIFMGTHGRTTDPIQAFASRYIQSGDMSPQFGPASGGKRVAKVGFTIHFTTHDRIWGQ